MRGGTHGHELQNFGTKISNKMEEHVYHSRYGRVPSIVSGDHSPWNASDQGNCRQPLGRPTAKKRVDLMHALAASLSLICLALAIASVANEKLSWHLGFENLQLIVLGFLLSIMNLCLTSVSPSLFLLLEAKYGPSTLQNYEGILRNQILSSKLTLLWRLTLLVNLVLPIGLSVAYKTFTGGESKLLVDATTYNKNASYYGMFALPGLQSFGARTGASLFSNATQQFVASSSKASPEPPLPTNSQAYGFNLLSINNRSTAMLDLPQPSYITSVQNLLAEGESWTMTAQVFATVATFNDSQVKNKEAFKSDFFQTCREAEASSGAKTHQSMMNDWSINLIDLPSPGNQSQQFIALAPDPGIQHEPECSDLVSYAQPYHIYRQRCNGTWTITRGTIELKNGTCDDTTALSSEKQKLITDNSLFLGVWFMNSLVELLGPFATTRNQSQWTGRYFATGMSAMLWSRITIKDSISNPERPDDWQRMFGDFTDEDLGLIYPVNDSVIYTRPAIRKSSTLYFVLILQPTLTIVVLILLAVLHSTPVGKNFGLVTILSGIDHEKLDILHGAALSGDLAKKVQLIMQPKENNGTKSIRYLCQELDSTVGKGANKGKLTSGMVYH